MNTKQMTKEQANTKPTAATTNGSYNSATLSPLLITTLNKEVLPAMGCTEPVAVALAVSKAKELFTSINTTEAIEKIEVLLSPNVYKNGLAVGIPGTKEVGLIIASALGFVSGISSNDLKVLSTVTPDDVITAKKMILDQLFDVGVKDTARKIEIEVTIKSATHMVKSIIMDRHNKFVYLSTDHQILLDEIEIEKTSNCENPIFEYPLIELIQAIKQLPHEEIAFLLEGITMNKSMAQYGLDHDCGMNVGATLKSKVDQGDLCDDMMIRAMVLTAAASDARMEGVSLPVMSSSGSGNNGLTAILPIVAFNEFRPQTPENLAKAIAMSHIVNSYIKNAIGRLSALCGCGVAAGTGASVAIAWLMGATDLQLEFTVNNMIANTSGMICDGAKVGCALKLATSASAAVQSALLSISNIGVPKYNGIIGSTVEKTISNLSVLSDQGMLKTDAVMLALMIEMQDDLLR